MLQQMQQEDSKENKILKITESQYKRLFKENFPSGKAVEKLSKRIKKSGMDENAKKLDLVDFAQEVVVFVKDVLSKTDPRSIPYSPYWQELGLSKGQLFNLIKKHGLVDLVDEQNEIREYAAPKFGFRKKIKELYNTLSEFDGGYPAGADNSSAPWNQQDGNQEAQEVIITIPDEKKKFRILHMGEDGMSIFKAGGELFVASQSDIEAINDNPEEWDGKLYMYDYKGQPDNVTARGFEDYINDMYNDGEMKPVRNDNTRKFPVPTLVTPRVRQFISKYYGNDPKMSDILNQMPETTGAASSGAYVAGASFGKPMANDTGNSPAQEMGELINDGIDSTGVVAFHSERNGEEPFIIDNIKWQYVNADYGGKVDIGVYRYGQDITYSYDWFQKNVLDTLNKTNETTSTGTVGAGVGANGQGTQTTPQYAYDAPAGDGKDFWTAGNKQNKKMGTNGTPIIRGGVKESKQIKESIKVGQVYKNGLARRKVTGIKKHPLTQSKKVIVVQQWGDGSNRVIKIDPKEWGNWDLLIERKIIRVTEEQFNKIVESENMSKTAYPNGDMVSFDDCTKFNNNKEAQNGGCSQGAVDNVVKTSKTKGSVVAEGFNPNVAAGSTYAIEVKPMGARVYLKQDNGQVVVTHYDDIPDLIKVLNSIY